MGGPSSGAGGLRHARNPKEGNVVGNLVGNQQPTSTGVTAKQGVGERDVGLMVVPNMRDVRGGGRATRDSSRVASWQDCVALDAANAPQCRG